MDTGQLDAFPLSSSEAVLNTLAQIVTSVNRLAPDLSGSDCLLLQGELALLRICLDSVEHRLRSHVQEQARRLGLI